MNVNSRPFKSLDTRIAILTILFTLNQAFADELHYNNSLIGDRATGMGGAYTAISDDPSGLFYNPAGIVYAGKRNLSASVNAFKTTTTTYKSVLGGGDWVRESSNLLPNFFGITQPIGKGTVGFSYAVTDSILENQDSTFTNIPNLSLFRINVNESDSTYKIGPSYALALTDTLSIGTTVYAHIRNKETILNQWVRKTNDPISTQADIAYEWSNLYVQTDDIGFEPIIGIMWSPFNKLSLGLSIRNTILQDSKETTLYNCVSDIPASQQENTFCHPIIVLSTDGADTPITTVSDPYYSESNYKKEYPLTTSVGIAIFPTNRLLLSADFIYYEETRDYLETWNASIGTEYYLNDTWAFRGGLFTNNANTRLQPGSDHVDIVGFSLSMSRFTRNSSITGGLSYSFGTGDALIVNSSTDIQEVEITSLSFYLSSSYSY